jgi:hypothetical protein
MTAVQINHGTVFIFSRALWTMARQESLQSVLVFTGILLSALLVLWLNVERAYGVGEGDDLHAAFSLVNDQIKNANNTVQGPSFDGFSDETRIVDTAVAGGALIGGPLHN